MNTTLYTSTEKIALIDLDGTIADYQSALIEKMEPLFYPGEDFHSYKNRARDEIEPPYIKARRKLIQKVPGFWRNLKPLHRGFEVVDELRRMGFSLHVLTKGPRSTPSAWAEKLEWCREYIEDAKITVTTDKSIVYGRVLVDDYPPYFTEWLKHRPRGLVVCIAHPWNTQYDGNQNPLPDNRVFRYDGTNRKKLRAILRGAYER